MKKYETKSLFYKKFPFKIVCYNSLAHEFRNNKLHNVSKVLDTLQLQKENGTPLKVTRYWTYNVDNASFNDAWTIYNELQKQKDYQLRVQFSTLSIFSLEEKWLFDLGTKLNNCYEFHSPGELGITNPGEILLRNSNGHKYRITFNNERLSESAIGWILKNKDNLKIGPTLNQYLNNNDGYVQGLYMYVKHEKMLTLVNLMLSGNIRSIDKVIVKPKTA